MDMRQELLRWIHRTRPTFALGEPLEAYTLPPIEPEDPERPRTVFVTHFLDAANWPLRSAAREVPAMSIPRNVHVHVYDTSNGYYQINVYTVDSADKETYQNLYNYDPTVITTQAMLDILNIVRTTQTTTTQVARGGKFINADMFYGVQGEGVASW